jgi:hypothetical protein
MRELAGRHELSNGACYVRCDYKKCCRRDKNLRSGFNLHPGRICFESI